MDGKAIRDRIKAIKDEIAAIQVSEEFYRNDRAHTGIEKAAHKARREALEAIKAELGVISRRNLQ
jgi:hypothetical protein